METILYEAHELRVFPVVQNPNGVKTQTVLIYKNGAPLGGSYADIAYGCAVTKAMDKIDHYKFN